MIPTRPPGNPGVVKREAAELVSGSGTMLSIQRQLATLASQTSGRGEALTAALGNVETVTGDLSDASTRYRTAGDALAEYAITLDSAQQAAASAAAAFASATDALATATRQAAEAGRDLAAATMAFNDGAREEAERKAGYWAGQAADASQEIAQATGAFTQAMTDIKVAGDRAAVMIQNAIDGSRLNDSLLDDIKGAIDDLKNFAIAAAKFVKKLKEELDKAALALVVIVYAIVRGAVRADQYRKADHRINTAARDIEATHRFYGDRDRQRHADTMRHLAKDAYDDATHDTHERRAIPNGWTRLSDAQLRARGMDPAMLRGDDGFAAAIYRGPDGQYVVAFRGSEGMLTGNADDWLSNAVNSSGVVSSQSRRAVALAQETVSTFGADKVSFTGHSLGGSHAAVASVATGRPATTFNAAGVGDGNLQMARNAGGGRHTDANITNFRTPTDIVSWGQQETTASPLALGTQITVSSREWEPVRAHALEAFVWPPDGRTDGGWMP